MIMNGTFFGIYRERKSSTSAIAAAVSDWKTLWLEKYKQWTVGPGSPYCIYFWAIARIVVIKWKPAWKKKKFQKGFNVAYLIRPAITQKAKPVFKQCMQICSSWNITSCMLQSYWPNFVIILLSFLWLPSVLQLSKQTLALWSYRDRFSVIRSIMACN